MIHRRSVLLAALSLPIAKLPAMAAVEPDILVMKSPTCGCCSAWVTHLDAAGLGRIESRNLADEQLWAMKARLGITEPLASCHTALLLGRYVIEGHVPASDIRRLMQDQPEALGLTVPGMPIGSPGMEMQDQKETYDTLLIHADGTTSVYATHT